MEHSALAIRRMHACVRMLALWLRVSFGSLMLQNMLYAMESNGCWHRLSRIRTFALWGGDGGLHALPPDWCMADTVVASLPSPKCSGLANYEPITARQHVQRKIQAATAKSTEATAQATEATAQATEATAQTTLPSTPNTPVPRL